MDNEDGQEQEESGGGEEQAQEQEQAPIMHEDAKYQRVVKAQQGLSAQVKDLKAELAEARKGAGVAESLTRDHEELQAAHAALTSEFSTFRDIAKALKTTDSDAIEAAQWQYGRLPEDGRPELGAWLEGMVADPTTAPTVLRGFITGGERQAASSGRRGAGGKTPDPAKANVDPNELAKIRQNAVETGDWSKYRAVREQVVGKPR